MAASIGKPVLFGLAVCIAIAPAGCTKQAPMAQERSLSDGELAVWLEVTGMS